MISSALRNDGHGLFVRNGLFVWAFRDERVVDVRDGHHSGYERNFLPFESMRIAGAVPFFAMKLYGLPRVGG